ncbi:hypothetical protein [Neorhodopirellula pilleata]|uniref:Uncharacterized protein n=1 Tax=Neorhodopirellula pilleata TaxID=2714738 RepID=A0A5C6AR84_9BACT|nr:hypothetical protein [Neorhodopirellula pilleata]TWU02078.1 hypothetical protein Pla100_18180 [Neorhodopirellula pilleata]
MIKHLISLDSFGWFQGILAVTRTHDLAPEYVAPVDAGAGVLPWVIGAVVAIVVVVAAYCIIRQMRIPVIPINDDLTQELCRAHGIGVQHRGSLDRIAHLAGLKSPAQMFLSAQLFDEAVSKASQVKRLGIRQRGLVFEVRYCLYG